MIVEDPHAIKLLCTPKYAEIIRMISEEEFSVSDVARKLGANSGSIYYHMKELEKHGLVRLVREEIAGGVVKKYYRKAAMNFTFNISDPSSAAAAAEAGINEEFWEKLIKSLSYMGYNVLPGKMDEAKRDLMAMDGRSKAILAEVQQSGLEQVEKDRLVVANTYQVAIMLRLVEDEQFLEAVKKFSAGFLREHAGKQDSKKKGREHE
jgi:DNA-binding transcriptional ArsR family regulator